MFYCADIDECAVRNGNCPAESTCVNNVGSYVCVCDSGYRREGSRCVGQWLISAQFLVFLRCTRLAAAPEANYWYGESPLLFSFSSPPFLPFSSILSSSLPSPPLLPLIISPPFSLPPSPPLPCTPPLLLEIGFLYSS